MCVTHFLPVFLLTKVQKIRDEVHDLDKKTRMMAGILNKLHSTPSDQSASFPALGALYLNPGQSRLCLTAYGQSSRAARRIHLHSQRSSLQTSFGGGRKCGLFPYGTQSTPPRWSST